MLDDLITAFSGPSALFMYLIAALLAYAIAIAVERSYLFWIFWKPPETGPEDLKKWFKEQAWGELRGHFGNHPAHLICTTLEQSIQQGDSIASSEQCWSIMETISPHIEEKVTKRLSMLGAIGNIATMLGLLGTVYGLIFALGGLDQASSIERTARLSEGIAAAMSTTAWGLLVGIPALALHTLLASKSKSILAQVEIVAAQAALHLPQDSKKS
ncbi:MAG: hypothetical protein CMK59_12160 [Proteobacteria bacterium]|nr:hypothetical protein [Pseudomonadota bacterium]